ncbi:MAG: hypothetical protein KDA34_14860 [Phycisphaerales bacterium]|nr:hypothetical protein [Phycisphaerales bacterium]
MSNDVLVVNLHTRMIERLGASGLAHKQSYPIQVPGDVESGRVHPFGIDVHDGHVYYGVTVDGDKDQIAVAVSRISLATGANEQLFTFPLDYDHRPPWLSWMKRGENQSASDSLTSSFPVVADLAVLGRDKILVGLMNINYLYFGAGYSYGDILIASRTGENWILEPPDHFQDRGGAARFADKDPLTGLFAIDVDARRVVAGGGNVGLTQGLQSVSWFQLESGAIVGPADGLEGFSDDQELIGDIDITCARHSVTATPSRAPSPTATPLAPTQSLTPSATPSAAPPSI